MATHSHAEMWSKLPACEQTKANTTKEGRFYSEQGSRLSCRLSPAAPFFSAQKKHALYNILWGLADNQSADRRRQALLSCRSSAAQAPFHLAHAVSSRPWARADLSRRVSFCWAENFDRTGWSESPKTINCVLNKKYWRLSPSSIEKYLFVWIIIFCSGYRIFIKAHQIGLREQLTKIS